MKSESKIILLLTFFILISCSSYENEKENIEQNSSSDVITIPVNISQPNF